MIVDGFNSKLVAKRLDHVLNDYMLRNKIERRRHLCTAWKLNEYHVSNVINGYKVITLGMIQALLEHGHVSIDWLLGGIGEMYLEKKKSEIKRSA